jgi:hypothetical protein
VGPDEAVGDGPGSRGPRTLVGPPGATVSFFALPLSVSLRSTALVSGSDRQCFLGSDKERLSEPRPDLQPCGYKLVVGCLAAIGQVIWPVGKISIARRRQHPTVVGLHLSDPADLDVCRGRYGGRIAKHQERVTVREALDRLDPHQLIAGLRWDSSRR